MLGGPASHLAVPVREQPTRATTTNDGKHPQGLPRGGEDERPNRTETMESTRKEQWTMTDTVACACGKVCKHFRGLKIHQARSNCQQPDRLRQRKGLPDKTREKTGPVANHSTRSLSAPVLSLTGSGCWPEELQSLESLAETEKAVGDSSEDELLMTQTDKTEESPIFSQFIGEESPIFPPKARESPAVTPNEQSTDQWSTKDRRKVPNITKRQKISWPRSNDKKWDREGH